MATNFETKSAITRPS